MPEMRANSWAGNELTLRKGQLVTIAMEGKELGGVLYADIDE
jgi:hypothetical protein